MNLHYSQTSNENKLRHYNSQSNIIREKNTQTGVSFDYIPNHKFYLWRVKIESVHSKKISPPLI